MVGYKCNNRCRFCIGANKRNSMEKTTQSIILEMIEARNRGRSYLEITGGEETIRPDFLHLIKMAKKLGFEDIVIATNGRMLAYKDFSKKLVDAGITCVIFSIHGYNARLHDYLTQVKGSFQELVQGIRNMRDLGFTNIASNTTIVRQNYKFLYKIGEFIYGLDIRNAEFIFVDPTHGGACDNFEKLVPKISEAAPYIRKCLDIGRNNKVYHWHVRYVPLCYFVGYEDRISELHEEACFQTEHLAPDFKNYDVTASRKKIARIKTKNCEECAYFASCEGLWKKYAVHYGTEELKPIKREQI